MSGEKEAAAALAHEVKNPLELIRSNLDLISAALKGKEEERHLQLIYRELDRINALLSGFTDKREECCIIYLEDLLCDVIDEYHVTGGKRVEFIIETTGDEVCVVAGYSKLCILFFNLLKNAVEAVEDKGSILTSIEKRGNTALVSIADNGRGLDESIAAVIGRPFVTSKADGMGLGLAICKKIAAEYKGTLTLENRAEGGCVATVTLPAYK